MIKYFFYTFFLYQLPKPSYAEVRVPVITRDDVDVAPSPARQPVVAKPTSVKESAPAASARPTEVNYLDLVDFTTACVFYVFYFMHFLGVVRLSNG